jgi:hypothetical protein
MNERGTDRHQQEPDNRLLADLRRVAAEADPVPEIVVAAARAAITTRDLDSEVAALVADSTETRGEDPAAPEPVRADPAQSRMLSFAGGGLQVDLEVTQRGAVTDVIGQLTGAPVAGCVLEYAGGRQPLSPDELGRFVATGIRPGPLRVRCRSATGGSVTTSWVTV